MSVTRSTSSARNEVRGGPPKLLELSETTAMTAGRIAKNVFEEKKA